MHCQNMMFILQTLNMIFYYTFIIFIYLQIKTAYYYNMTRYFCKELYTLNILLTFRSYHNYLTIYVNYMTYIYNFDINQQISLFLPKAQFFKYKKKILKILNFQFFVGIYFRVWSQTLQVFVMKASTQICYINTDLPSRPFVLSL